MSMSSVSSVLTNILHRRTVKTTKMNGETIPEEVIGMLLAAADAAPTHARTEPWRMYVYDNAALQEFCAKHAQLYWDNTPEEKRSETSLNAIGQHHKYASHMILMVMKRTEQARIPWEEEYAACCAAVQNILLMAAAHGVASIWSTGGMAYHQVMKDYLGIGHEDRVVGLIYLGYTDDKEAHQPVRNIPLSAKVHYQ